MINFSHFSNKQKAILLVCTAIIFLGGGIGISSLKKAPIAPPSTSQPETTIIPTPVPAFFSLTSENKILKVGETFSLSLSLSSGDFAVDAVDLILTYDPELFKAQKITPGTIFDLYSVKQIDNQQGKVQLSATSGLKKGKVVGFSGAKEFGVISFEALKASTGAQIIIDFNSIAAAGGKSVLNLDENTQINYTITTE